MVTKNETFVNTLSQINLLAFYIVGLMSLASFVLGHYEKFGFQLIIALLNLYTYFDLTEDKE